MKQFSIVVLLLVMLLLLGCGAEQGNTVSAEAPYTSNTSTVDCYLCGGGIEDLIPSFYLGQNNLALISLNTFDIKLIEINRYDRLTGQPIEEYAGTVSLGGGGSKDGGFSASLMLDDDRGYADGTLEFYSDKVLDISKAAGFLCADCMNRILPPKSTQCFGVGVLHLDTKQVRVFEKQLSGFGLGDFYIDCDLTSKSGDRMDILIFYCPIQYEKEI